MTENILSKMIEQKNRLINEAIFHFLGHAPTTFERKEFTFMHRLGESLIYRKGKLIDIIKYETEDGMAKI
jgi:hypothetical protein